MSQLIYNATASIPDLVIERDNDCLILQPAQVTYDVENFLHAFSNRHYEIAGSLYRGDYLTDRQLLDYQWIDDWRSQIGVQLRTKALHGFNTLMHEAERSAEWKAAVEWADRVISIAPYDEPAHVVRITAATALSGTVDGFRTAQEAIRAFADMDIPISSPSLLRLTMAPSAPFPTETSDVLDSAPTFRGRANEVAVLTDTWRAAVRGHQRVAVVNGPQGIGKTRLAEHFLRWAVLRGSKVVLTHASPAEKRLPYSSLIDLLASAFADRAPAQLSEPSATTIKALLDHSIWIANSYDPESTRRAIFEAVAEAVATLASEEAPVVIYVDNAHWCDGLSAWALHYAFQRVGEVGVVLILTSTGEIEELPEEFRLLIETSAPGSITRVALRPLERQFALDIAREAAERNGRATGAEILDAVVDAARGVPYSLVQSVLEAPLLGSPYPAHRPRGAEAPQDYTAVDLDEASTAVLRAVSILGSGTEETIGGTAAVNKHTVRTAVQHLEKLNYLRSHRGRITFVNDLDRTRILAAIGREAVAMNGRAANLLEQNDSTPPGVLAVHFAAANSNRDAFKWAIVAAGVARAASSHSDAEFYLQLAVSRATSSDERLAASVARVEYLCDQERLEDARLEVRRSPQSLPHLRPESARLISLYSLVADGESVADSFRREAESLIPALSPNAAEIDYNLVRRIIGLAHSTGNVEATSRLIRTTAERRHLLRPSPESAKLLASLSRVWCIYHDGPTSLKLASEAIEVATKVKDRPSQVLALVARATVRMLQGKLLEAELDFTLAESLATDQGLETYLDRLRVNRAVLLLESGRFEECDVQLERVLPRCNLDDQLVARANLVLSALEARNSTNLPRRLSDLLRTNRHLQCGWVDGFALCIEGHLQLMRGELDAAVETGKRVEGALSENPFAAGSDASYADLLIGKCRAITNPHDGVAFLQSAERIHARNNILGMYRLRLERARCSAGFDFASWRVVAESVLRECRALGASTLAQHALQLLTETGDALNIDG